LAEAARSHVLKAQAIDAVLRPRRHSHAALALRRTFCYSVGCRISPAKENQ
jgi:hypothetical protein